MPGPVYSETEAIRATPTAVWQALVDATRVAEYHLAPLKVVELRPGGRIVYGMPDEDMIVGRVVRAEENKKLEHTFRFGADHAGTQDDPETIVAYVIEDTEEGVKLTVTHAGFPDENQTYANICGGWPFLLEGLKASVEKASA